MNEQLKFSWGHIIAFLGLIIISYISFVGVTYMTDGDFSIASIAMIAIDFILFIFFIGAQIMKATERKFARRIWIERIFIFSSPIIFLFAMIPFFHFGTVQSQDEEIVGHFTDAISSSKQMFSDYDAYSNERIMKYEHMLNRVISNRSKQPDDFKTCGFMAGKEGIQKENMVKTLRLQLISENYDSLKTEATEWIESSSNGASTWNVFLLGNTKEIKKAIHKWSDQLEEFANKKLTNEEFNGFNKVKTFSGASVSLDAVDKGLDGLTDKFTKSAFPPFGSIIGSIILYFALLFPYFIQDRHTKNQFRLIGMEKGATRSSNTNNKISKSVRNEKENKKPKKVEDDESSNDDDDDYKSFTI